MPCSECGQWLELIGDEGGAKHWYVTIYQCPNKDCPRYGEPVWE